MLSHYEAFSVCLSVWVFKVSLNLTIVKLLGYNGHAWDKPYDICMAVISEHFSAKLIFGD